MEISEQLAERDLVATRKTLRGTHLGELWNLPPTGNRVELEFIDIFRVPTSGVPQSGVRREFGTVALSRTSCGDEGRRQSWRWRLTRS